MKSSFRFDFGGSSEAGEICFAIGSYHQHWCIAFGWGYDKEMPLRPWPQYSIGAGSKSGSLIRCISLLGFFFTWGY